MRRGAIQLLGSRRDEKAAAMRELPPEVAGERREAGPTAISVRKSTGGQVPPPRNEHE